MKLSGRHIVITGAASGIGRATAEMFVREGAQVALLDIDAQAVQAAAQAIGGTAVPVDVTSEASVRDAVAQAEAALGGIDGLVNSAGISTHGLIEDTDFATWQRVLAVNLNGPFLVCRAALPWLKKAARATVVNIASGTAMQPFAGGSAYAASKAGLVNFNRVLAKEHAPLIRANVVCPGLVDTPMVDALERDRESLVKTVTLDKYALKRKAKPEEIAAAILFLTSDDSSFITGSALVVDGGRIFY